MPFNNLPVTSLLGAVVAMFGGVGTAQAQIAVIVNGASSTSEVSMTELRDVFLGNSTVFQDGTRIHLIQNRVVDDLFYQRVVRRSARDMTRHWIGRVLSGEGGTPPREVDAFSVLGLVAADRGAISFVETPVTDATVKVLRVDGLMPGEPNYPLRHTPSSR